MSLMDKLERNLRFLDFPNLHLYMTVIFLMGLAINMISPTFYFEYLSLNVGMILKGQIYRLITFVFFPPSSGSFILLSLLMIYIYYSICRTLVMMWGNFKFNLYFFIGYLSQILCSFIVYFIIGPGIIMYPVYTTFSIIMAFALSFPDSYFMIYFLIPLKAKYFAYMEIALYVVSFLFSGLPNRIAIFCSAINVIVFFGLLKRE